MIPPFEYICVFVAGNTAGKRPLEGPGYRGRIILPHIICVTIDGFLIDDLQ
jgi:hypothetical protein